MTSPLIAYEPMRGNFSDIIIMFQISLQHFDKSMPENS